MSNHKTVKLNIGGKFYETTPETLRKSKYFCDLLDKDWDDNNTLFVDRDGFLFRFILLYLRTDELDVDRKHLKSLKNEAGFYLLPKLSQLIERAMCQKPKNITYKLLDGEELTQLYNVGVHGMVPTSNPREEPQNINFIATIRRLEKVYVCPRDIPVHDNVRYFCGKACKKARGNDYEEYECRDKTRYLVSVESD